MKVRGARARRGFSLLELLLVVSILAIMALALIPDATPTRRGKVDLAVSELADAVRFARSEAIRRGEPYGLRFNSANDWVRVFRADMGVSPPSPVFDAYHPVSKRLYELDFANDPRLAEVALANPTDVWTATCDGRRRLIFDPTGVPHCGDPYSVLLVGYAVKLNYAGVSRLVLVDGETGRVTVQ